MPPLRVLPFCLVLAALAFAGCGVIPRGVPATAGLANFGWANDRLFRGAQPDAAALAQLHARGIRTVINLRPPDEAWDGEPAAARALGLVHHTVPLRGFDAPGDAAMSQVLALITASPGPVYIHCEYGADRTGTVIACYRIRHDGWSAERALAEAQLYGFSSFQAEMRRFILSFPPADRRP